MRPHGIRKRLEEEAVGGERNARGGRKGPPPPPPPPNEHLRPLILTLRTVPGEDLSAFVLRRPFSQTGQAFFGFLEPDNLPPTLPEPRHFQHITPFGSATEAEE